MKKTILVVDSIGKIRIEITSYLKKYNAEIVHAKDEIEALNRLKDSVNKIKLIIWCIYTDNNQDFDIIKKFKSLDVAKDIPIAIISVYSEKKYVFKAIEAGAVEYIIRPFTQELITRKISEILGISTIGETTDAADENEQEEFEEDKIVLSLKEILSINIKSASRGKYPLSILMLTLMNVSESNTQERKIVSTIIKALKTKLRETDIIVKYASDNILLILPFADSSGVTIVHEKIKQLIYENTFLNEKSKGHILSSSYVTFPEDGKHQEHLLAKLQSKLQPILVFLDEDIL